MSKERELLDDTLYVLETLLETVERLVRETPPTTKVHHITKNCLKTITKNTRKGED